MMSTRPTRLYAGAGYSKTKTGAQYRGGLFRCDAEEGRWEALTNGLPENVEARVFAFDPRSPGTMYVGTNDGPYRSLDAGDHWERLGFSERGAVVWALAFHPTRPEIMYAGLAPVGVYRSENGGETWTKLPGAVDTGHCPMRFPTRALGIAVEPSRPDDVYVALEVSGVIHSRDGGETWTDVSAPLIKLSEQSHLRSRLSSNTDASGMLDSHAITISQAKPGRAVLGVRMGLFATEDHGESWYDMEVGRYSPLTYCRDVIVSPHDPRVMYAGLSASSRGNAGSIYRSEDAGATWERFDHGIKAEATIMSVAVHPTDASQVCAVSRCGQVFATRDGGTSWREYRLADDVRDVYAVACG